MNINIKTDKEKFFLQYLNVIKPLLGSKLANQEIEVLSQLLYYNNEYKDLDVKARGIVIFDYDTRVKIMEKLDISYNTLGNNLLKLRKKGFVKGNTIKESLIVYPEKKMNINYNFTLT